MSVAFSNPGASSELVHTFVTNGDCIFKLLRSPGIDSKESIPEAYVACAGILEQSMRVRNRRAK